MQNKQDKFMIGSPEKSITKQKLEEQVSNAIFYFFIQHNIKKSHSLKDMRANRPDVILGTVRIQDCIDSLGPA